MTPDLNIIECILDYTKIPKKNPEVSSITMFWTTHQSSI